MHPSRQGRRTLFLACAVLLGALAAWLLAEAVAFLMPLKRNPFYITDAGIAGSAAKADPRLPHTRPPHLDWEGWSQGDIPGWIPDAKADRRRLSFRTDADGFRNTEQIAKADIVFIGDSFTEAGNVAEADSFVRLAAAKLGRTAKNLGVFAYDPLSELIVLEQHGLACDPRLVVWQISESNDLPGAARQAGINRAWEESGSLSRLPPRSYRIESWKARSPFHAFLRLLEGKPRYWLSGTFRDASGRDLEMRFGYRPTHDHFPLGHPAAPWGKTEHPGWRAIIECIENGRNLLARNGIDLVVLHIPMKLTIYARHVRFDDWSVAAMPYYPPVLPLVDYEQSLAGQLAPLCARLEIPFVDPAPQLEEAAAAGGLVYFPGDTHLSERGHEIVADSLVPVLAKRLR